MSIIPKLDQSSEKIATEKVQLSSSFCGKLDSWTLVVSRNNDLLQMLEKAKLQPFRYVQQPVEYKHHCLLFHEIQFCPKLKNILRKMPASPCTTKFRIQTSITHLRFN